MKKLFIFLLSSTILSIASGADRVLVKFYPPNKPYSGLTNYPAEIRKVDWTTNSTGWNTNWSSTEYMEHITALAPIFQAGESNAVYLVKIAMDTNIARLVQLYDGISAGRTELRNFATATNTLTTAQLTTATRKMADYQEKIMEFLQRLGPVLKSIYRPEDDPAQ